MGQPSDLRRVAIDVAGTTVGAVVLRVGNPQCVVLEHTLDEARYRRLGAPSNTIRSSRRHERRVRRRRGPRRVRILIWRGASGRPSPPGRARAQRPWRPSLRRGREDRGRRLAGGSQRVEWLDDGLYLTGGRRRLGGPMDPLIRTAPGGRGRRGLFPAEQQSTAAGRPSASSRSRGVPGDAGDADGHAVGAGAPSRGHHRPHGGLVGQRGRALAVTALLGPLLAIVLHVAPARRPWLVRRSDHLPVHRQLHHRGGDVRPRPRPPDRVHGAVLTPRRPKRGPAAGRVRLLSTVLSMWISNTRRRDDVPDRPVDRVASVDAVHRGTPRFRRFATTIMLISAYGPRSAAWRPRSHAAQPHRLGMLREVIGRNCPSSAG